MIPQMSQVSDKAMAYKIQLERPPATAVELWHLVNAMWGVKIADAKKCSEHVSPFHAFSDAYFAKDPNWALWYGSRGCLAGDSLITVNRAGNSVKRRMDRFVPRFNNTMVELEGQLAGGRAYRTDIQTKVQRADGEYARLGVVGTAYSSGVKHTYELVTETGRKIRATAEHPFATADGFIPLGELTVGSSVLVNRGKSTSGRRAKQRYARVMAKYHPQATKGQYWVHRLVVEAQLNQMAVEDYLELLNTDPHAVVVLQFLPEGMHVHHLNGDPLDNRAENLLPMTEQQHHQLHADSGKTSHVLDRIGEERIADIRSHGPEPTYDLTMANGPNNYIANGFVVHNTGKSYMLATLALTKAVILEINVTLLGGSMAQSVNVREHVDSLLRKPNAPRFAVANHISTEILFNNGNWIRPLPASQTTVRGPHPHATMLDEIDEMEKKIYDAAQGQAMALPNHLGIEIPEMTVASSTWQNPSGTFTDVMREARSKGLPIHSWCWREVIRNAQQPHGWMDPGFIERKRASVPAEMFRVEYELGEPSGEARAFDLEAVNHTFTQMDPQQEFHRGNDDEWVFEAPEPGGVYAAGADWAKERDKTVLVVQRTDVTPWKLVYVRIFNKRPWPYMIGEFNSLVSRYSAVSAHDATGLGNVVHDMVDERTIKVVMVGQDRTKLLTEYIAALEQGRYTMARNTPLYAAHADTTVDDVFGAARWNTHLADEVAACAIAHRAATRMAGPSAGEIVKRSNERPVWLQKVDPKSNSSDDSFEYVYDTGVVSVSQGSDDVGVFWL